MKKLILIFSVISLVVARYSDTHKSFVVDLQRGDNAHIDVTGNCIKIWNPNASGSYHLCCNENFPKDITIPYFDLRSDFEQLKSDFREFTENRRDCRWERRR